MPRAKKTITNIVDKTVTINAAGLEQFDGSMTTWYRGTIKIICQGKSLMFGGDCSDRDSYSFIDEACAYGLKCLKRVNLEPVTHDSTLTVDKMKADIERSYVDDESEDLEDKEQVFKDMVEVGCITVVAFDDESCPTHISTVVVNNEACHGSDDWHPQHTPPEDWDNPVSQDDDDED